MTNIKIVLSIYTYTAWMFYSFLFLWEVLSGTDRPDPAYELFHCYNHTPVCDRGHLYTVLGAHTLTLDLHSSWCSHYHYRMFVQVIRADITAKILGGVVWKTEHFMTFVIPLYILFFFSCITVSSDFNLFVLFHSHQYVLFDGRGMHAEWCPVSCFNEFNDFIAKRYFSDDVVDFVRINQITILCDRVITKSITRFVFCMWFPLRLFGQNYRWYHWPIVSVTDLVKHAMHSRCLIIYTPWS